MTSAEPHPRHFGRSDQRLVRVAILDDHPAVRAGLQAMLEPEPDLVAVGAAADEFGLWRLLELAEPSMVILDIAHPGGDGLTLTMRLKELVRPRHVILYSGAPKESISIAATLAGVDAVVAKTEPRRELLETVRAVAAGSYTPAAIPMRLRRRAAAELDATDQAIVAMRLAHTSLRDIAATLQLDLVTVTGRFAAVVRGLAAHPPADSGRGLSRTAIRSARRPPWHRAVAVGGVA